jgi:hypothetical protein
MRRANSMPFMIGIARSQSTASGRRRSSCTRPSSPAAATTVVAPSASTRRLTTSRVSSSSSMTRTVRPRRRSDLRMQLPVDTSLRRPRGAHNTNLHQENPLYLQPPGPDSLAQHVTRAGPAVSSRRSFPVPPSSGTAVLRRRSAQDREPGRECRRRRLTAVARSLTSPIPRPPGTTWKPRLGPRAGRAASAGRVCR